MSVFTKAGARSAIALAVAGGAVLSGIALAGSAHAATTPTFEPDPNAVGNVYLYDTNGNRQTSGSLTTPFAYFVADGGATPGSTGAASTKATAYVFTPVDNTDPQTWSSTKETPSTTYGTAASANYPGGLKNLPYAIAVNSNPANTFATAISNFPSASAKDPNIYQVRIVTGDQAHYYRMDVQVDPNAGTWTQVYQDPSIPLPQPPASTTTTIAANPTTVTAGDTVSLTGSVTPAGPGTVELFDGSTDKGAATYNAATGAISASDAPATPVQHSYTFKYTSSDTTKFLSSTSSAVVVTVNPRAQNTTTVVSGPTTGTVGDAVTYVASVAVAGAGAAPNGAGTVQFTVDGANAGTPVAVTNGTANFTYTLADTTSHTIKAAFTHTTGQLYNDSADTTGVTVTATAAANAPDPQSAVVNVPAGTLVISTPWTNAHPFILGNLVLDPNGNGYSASGSFGNTSATAGNLAADPTSSNSQLAPGAKPADVDAAVAAQNAALGNGITITDTRANSQGWTASAQTTDFTNPTLNTPINGDNLTFHDLKVKYVQGNAIQSGVQVNNIAAFKSAKQSFAKFSTPNTPGTVAIAGTLTLTAPTSTKAGQYTATITFTIV